MTVVEIDGSRGEGGGQIVRLAIALSALTGKTVRVHHIRANRPRPGLAPQHLTAVLGVAGQCGAEVRGAEIDSQELLFIPGDLSGGEHRLEVGTAGSVTLVLQACLLPATRANTATRLEIAGGTNVRWSPPIDFYDLVLLPLLSRMGVETRLEVLERGFYPEGGGRVAIDILPAQKVLPLRLSERGGLRQVAGVCFSRNLPDHVCKRIAHTVRKRIPEVELRNDTGDGPSAGAGVMLVAEYENTLLAGDALGERGVPAEKVALWAVESLENEMHSPATLDIHAADQLLPYMAMAEGKSEFAVRQISEHLRTQMWLVPQFLEVSFAVERIEGGHRIRVSPSRT